MHNNGEGAKYTKGRRPVELIYAKEYDSKSKAMQKEYQIKQMPREKKIKLIEER